MAVITNAGLNLLATAVQTSGVNAAITFVDIAAGAGTLSSGLTSGTPTTSLPLDVGLPVALSAGQALTITDGTNTDTCVVAAGGALLGATSIPVNSFSPGHTYAAHTTGIAPTPLVGDIAIYNASNAVRIAANAGVAGANPGESLNSGYFDGTNATALYMTVGYFGGPAATSTPGTGVLVAEDIQYWNHVVNIESASFQLDSTI